MTPSLFPEPPLSADRPYRVFLLGYGTLGKAVLKGLLKSESCEIAGAFRWSQRLKEAGNYQLDADEREFAQLLREHNIPEYRMAGANSFEFIRVLEILKPDCLLVASWGEILKPHVLNIPGMVHINCHPSKLPAHRGANPYSSVIRAGEDETGVTFHLMDEKIDTGPILLQETLEIGFEDTGDILREKSSRVAEDMVPHLIALLQGNKEIKGRPQGTQRQSYFPAIKMEDGILRWARDPLDLYNQLRGLQPWLDCFSFLPVLPVAGFNKLGVFVVTFKKLVLLDEFEKSKHPPGMILNYRYGQLCVASSDPQTRLLFSGIRLHYWIISLPCWLSQFLGFFIFRKGRVFKS